MADRLHDAVAFIEVNRLDPIAVHVENQIVIDLLPADLSRYATDRELSGTFNAGWISVQCAGLTLRARV